MLVVVSMNTTQNMFPYLLRGLFNKFPDFFFVQELKIDVESWKFNMLLLYILWNGWPIFMISGWNEQLQHQLEYTLLNPDSHSWWISKMQSGREDILEERYAISFWVAWEIQGRHGVCEGWWEVWEK